ncbi:MAG TPA: DMT family transporter [Enterovirga sp.]|nr:DMT family transporter [Enterovirga sp.]
MTPRVAVLAMLAAMLIFGSVFPFSRYASLHGMRPEDMVVLRYGIAGPVLLPLFIKRGAWQCAGIGWRKGFLLFLTSGVPMALLMIGGLSLAPAAHGAALGPGTVTTVGVVYGMIAAGALPGPLTLVGFATILAGLVSIAIAGTTSGSLEVMLGDLMFFGSGLLWGFYPILLYRWRIGPMLGASIVSVLSIPYAVLYLAFGHPRLLEVGWTLLIGQAVFQGLFTVIFGLWLWGSGVRTLGAARTQLFPPMIPVIGTLLAIPVLGERPGPLQALGVGMIVTGLCLSAYGQRRAMRRAAES